MVSFLERLKINLPRPLKFRKSNTAPILHINLLNNLIPIPQSENILLQLPLNLPTLDPNSKSQNLPQQFLHFISLTTLNTK